MNIELQKTKRAKPPFSLQPISRTNHWRSVFLDFSHDTDVFSLQKYILTSWQPAQTWLNLLSTKPTFRTGHLLLHQHHRCGKRNEKYPHVSWVLRRVKNGLQGMGHVLTSSTSPNSFSSTHISSWLPAAPTPLFLDFFFNFLLLTQAH